MTRLFSLAILAVITIKSALAHNIDQALAFEEKRQVNLSTGGSGTTQIPTSNVPTSAQPTSNSVIITDSTVTVSPTGTPSTVFTTNTITQSRSTSATTSNSFSPVITSSVQQTIYTYVTTHDGITETATSIGETTIPVTTSAKVTPTALAGGQDGGSSGLNETSKKIIGGVVGGVGGALLVGALAFTAWRIWGKKKQNVHDDDLYDPNMGGEKLRTSVGDNTPFQSTLDQYHRPTGPVNTAQNF